MILVRNLFQERNDYGWFEWNACQKRKALWMLMIINNKLKLSMAKTFKSIVYKRNDDGTYRGCGQFAVLTEEAVKKAVKENDNLEFSDNGDVLLTVIL